MKEIWMPISGFEGLYEVSNLGRVKSLERVNYYPDGRIHQRKKEKLLSTKPDKRGYISVVLCKDGKIYPHCLHRLVAEAFIPNPEGKPNVDHIDTNPSNNMVDNLRWVTQQENALNPLTRKNISESKKGHPYWGRPLTEEEKKKISEAHKGRKFSEERRKAISEAHKGKSLSEETKKKLSESLKGHPVSESARQKMREKALGRNKGRHWKTEGGKRVWY